MNFDEIKRVAFEKSSEAIAKRFVQEKNEPKNELSRLLEEQDPEMAKLVSEQKTNIIIIEEMMSAMLEEYHKALTAQLKERGIDLNS